MLYYIHMKTTTHQQKLLYGILAVVVVILVALIGWFIYLLAKPMDSTTNNNNSIPVNNAATNKTKNKNTNIANANRNSKNNNNANNANSNANTNTNSNTNSNEAGLIEPDSNSNNNSNTNNSVEAPTGPTYSSSNTDATTETLYFSKSSGSCGEVVAVQRNFTPNDDPYGQIILDTMHGPNTDEVGVVDGIPSTVKLKQVQYTSEGSIITVNEAYNDLSDCEQKTVTAQLVSTANVMFDVSPQADGKVVVGEISTDSANTNE